MLGQQLGEGSRFGDRVSLAAEKDGELSGQ